MVIRDRKSGMTISDICKKYGRSASTIKNYLKEANLSLKEDIRKASRQRVRDVMKEHASGKTNKEIAQEMNISLCTVNAYIREDKLPEDPDLTYKESRCTSEHKLTIRKWAFSQIGNMIRTPEGRMMVCEVYPFIIRLTDSRGFYRTFTHGELYYLNGGDEKCLMNR